MKLTLLPKEACLCGSGLLYETCCYTIFSNFQKDVDINSLFEENEYQLAFQYAKADLTQYIYHLKLEQPKQDNTQLFLADKITDEDINNISSIIEKILTTITLGNLEVDFKNHLNNLYNSFYYIKWQQCITYYDALWTLIFLKDVDGAAEIIDRFGFNLNHKIDYLKLVLEVKYNKLSFSKKEELIKNIILKSSNLIDKAQYTAALSVTYLLIDDNERAKEIMIDAIQILDSIESEHSDVSSLFTKGHLYYLSADLNKNEGHFHKSIDCYESIIKIESVANEGTSYANIRLGYIHLKLDNPQKALEYFNNATSASNNAFINVAIAKTYIILENIDKALNNIENIDIKKLSEEQKIEYYFVAAYVYVLKNDKVSLNNLLKDLKTFKTSNQYHQKFMDDWIIKLQNFLLESSTQDNSTNELSTNNKLIQFLKQINEYIKLEPSFLGVGLNMNKIFNDIFERRQK